MRGIPRKRGEMMRGMNGESVNIKNRYPSRRSVVYGRKGMVCTSQTLAAQAGLDVLKEGGNAVDAAICTAICLTVLEPTSNGLGSDSFALVWAGGKLYGLNGSGPAPARLTPEVFRKMGCSEMPGRGWETVMVPGAVSSWAEFHKRFGRLPFRRLFDAAIGYARDGYSVQPVCAHLWQQAERVLQPFFRGDAEPAATDTKDAACTNAPGQDSLYRPLYDLFFRDGAPKAGDTVRLPELADTLEELAETGCESFYRGELAEKICAYAEKSGGYLSKEDLAAYRATWVEPVSVRYRGVDVYEIPPNGQGLVVLMALNILENFTMERQDEETIHIQLEAMKKAFIDGKTYIADPSCMRGRTEKLLDPEYGRRRAEEIRREAVVPPPLDLDSGGTVYLCTADEEGNMVSFIQSNFFDFGSGVVVPDTGICLNNRGNNFSLDPDHANCLAPGKKPYHTIIPGFLMKDGEPIGPFGVMGAFMQPQGQVQVVADLLDWGLDPQEALDAPRWQWVGGLDIQVEEGFPMDVVEQLRQRGHKVTVLSDFTTFGRGQMILRRKDGTLTGATEPRADGVVAAW